MDDDWLDNKIGVWQMKIESIIDVARGDAPADMLLKEAFVVNVFTGEILKRSVAVKDGIIAGVGDYELAEEIFDLTGKYLIPGLIDAHIHIESTMLTPPAFAAAVVPRGVTAVVADPHEIVNVTGLDGLQYMVDSSRSLPLDIFYMMPSCVPSTMPCERGSWRWHGATMPASTSSFVKAAKTCCGPKTLRITRRSISAGLIQMDLATLGTTIRRDEICRIGGSMTESAASMR